MVCVHACEHMHVCSSSLRKESLGPRRVGQRPWIAASRGRHLIRGLKTFHRTLMKPVGCTT